MEDPAAYGQAYADVYDDWYGDVTDVAATVRALARMCDGRRALELGVGTGRVAIPLAHAGFEVTGVDASPAMLDRLRAKPGGAEVRVVEDDMATMAAVTGSFDLVLVTFNTFFNLASDQAQRSCLHRVRRLLAPDGWFVVEAFVPAEPPDGPQSATEKRSDGAGGVVITVSARDPRTQVVEGTQLHRPATGPERERPWRIRYLHPPQLDAMCAQSGLAPAHRWADWDGTPFAPDSVRHVSWYRLDA